jgi:beta-lactam-binding protein with PASTA domain
MAEVTGVSVRVKSFFRHLLQALTLLVVALVSALTAMRFAIHGREIAVPDLVGKTPADARRIAELNGFQFEVERRYYSPTVPEGRVLSQVPSAGTLIRRGWQIRAAESLGAQRVQIPNVLGQSERAAEINIRRRGLDIESVAQTTVPDVAEDQVIGQSPNASASSISSPKMSLLTSTTAPKQAFVTPNFVGQTLGNVTQIVKQYGFKLGQVTLAPPDAELNQPVLPSSSTSIIVSQNPAAGQKIVLGDAISFAVR